MTANPDSCLRLVIADDEPVILHGLSMILGSEPDIEVVGQASDGFDVVKKALALQPDVVIMDLQMPGQSGAAATREVTTQCPQIRVVVLTTFDNDDLVFDAIAAGAHAYLLKEATEAEVLDTVRAVHNGESRLSPSIASKVLTQFRSLARTQQLQQPPTDVAQSKEDGATSEGELPEDDWQAVLTEKEQRILSLIAVGNSNRQIGETVHLAEGTVKNYVSRIMAKLHASSRIELAAQVFQRGD